MEPTIIFHDRWFYPCFAPLDREILADELEELSILLPSIDLDISLTGFEVGEIDVLLARHRRGEARA